MTKAVTALDDGDLSTLKMQYRRIELTARQALQLCVLAASLGSFCCGMFVGWSSHATVTLSAKVGLACAAVRMCGLLTAASNPVPGIGYRIAIQSTKNHPFLKL